MTRIPEAEIERLIESSGVALKKSGKCYIRLALHQSQPLGNERFYAKIEKMSGMRREAKPRGRPRLAPDSAPASQGK